MKITNLCRSGAPLGTVQSGTIAVDAGFVLGILKRDGELRSEVINDTTAATIQSVIRNNVKPGRSSSPMNTAHTRVLAMITCTFQLTTALVNMLWISSCIRMVSSPFGRY